MTAETNINLEAWIAKARDAEGDEVAMNAFLQEMSKLSPKLQRALSEEMQARKRAEREYAAVSSTWSALQAKCTTLDGRLRRQDNMISITLPTQTEGASTKVRIHRNVPGQIALITASAYPESEEISTETMVINPLEGADAKAGFSVNYGVSTESIIVKPDIPLSPEQTLHVQKARAILLAAANALTKAQ